ncbi:MAG: ribose 5-phosphate isomerase A [Longimicrobiales bacterium]|nr:ribose 5-phosphate isomerase A [Longimicrobiales bacterium]
MGAGSEGQKREAAREALTRVRSGMRLGLGTGSTVAHFLDLLGEALAGGSLEDVAGVPTSERTAAHAGRLGIPVGPLHELQPLDLAVDGADEVDPRLDLVKGLGGALLREKMVVQAAHRFVVIADESKVVDRLGTRAPLPVEVVPFAWEAHLGGLLTGIAGALLLSRGRLRL